MKKISFYFRKYFFPSLDKEELLKYRNILKLLYHKKAETPLMDNVKKGKYFIQVPSIKLDLIIEKGNCELINSDKIYPLELGDDVYNRVIIKINEEITKQRIDLEKRIKYKKQTILSNIFNTIK